MKPLVVVLGGVSGSGKSLVGEMLAKALGGDFFDGDDFHPPANKEKMHNHIPLTDADRLPWLQALADLIKTRQEGNRPTVVACSALKPEYRQVLLVGPNVHIILLDVPREELMRRLNSRKNHFFPADLLDSQLKTLVPPQPGEEGVIDVDAKQPPEEVVAAIRKALE